MGMWACHTQKAFHVLKAYLIYFTYRLISKLFCTKSCMGGENSCTNCKTHNIQYRIQNTAAEKPMYIKLPMYLFYMALGLNDFDGGKSITWVTGRGVPWKSRLFWALTWQQAKRVPFRPKKVLILPTSKSLRPKPTTGTLVVISTDLKTVPHTSSLSPHCMYCKLYLFFTLPYRYIHLGYGEGATIKQMPLNLKKVN